ncbi:MAG: bifunctional 5,10-methylenetetrahydrofolate dehydrogenase/5,10-methenyltetrahydrofolate cyclohydrolase [Elusimicrobiota bacterium]|jgi:methylenetetrahydrofolate dehydrogenase (NADP+)/methenyltetrahydrofolate cyclohydrolase|nr:bifunctional 5,10-methylenetetrahydrofolate dehydrogenase/5,10-methenyltetrahydrofolate cyclohydrolase [Elusimicrobiota bacterium]
MNMLLEGKTLSSQIRRTLGARAQFCSRKLGRPLKLAGIGWEGGYASYLYLKKELEAAQKLGISGELIEFNPRTAPEDFINLIKKTCAHESVDAVLIPKPLPKHLDIPAVWEALDAAKDIDGASTLNTGRLFLCKTAAELAAMRGFAPCTAKAVVELLKYHKIPLAGAEIAVIGRSSTVGKPAAHMLTCENATVKILHSKTKDIKASLAGADIVVCAIGSPRFLKADMLRAGAIVVDVGTNEDENGVYCGDVDYDNVAKIAGAISPVPGGVGPLTLTYLLENIIISAERKLK